MLDIITTQWHPLLSGLWNTILCSLIALVGSLIIGTFFVSNCSFDREYLC